MSACAIGPAGIVGDRGWALRDLATGKLCSAKRFPKLLMCSARFLEEPALGSIPDTQITLPDGTTIITSQADANDKLSAFLDHPVELHSSDNSEPAKGDHFDDLPISLLTSASLEALGGLLPSAKLEDRRFRPNLLIRSPQGIAGFVEAQWGGSRLVIGEVSMEIIKPIPRCPMVSAAQPALDDDRTILDTLLSQVDRSLGVYATAEESGMLRVGDPLSLDAS